MSSRSHMPDQSFSPSHDRIVALIFMLIVTLSGSTSRYRDLKVQIRHVCIALFSPGNASNFPCFLNFLHNIFAC